MENDDDDDYALALSLSLQLNGASDVSAKEQHAPSNHRGIVDPELELLDPNPNLHQLFLDFNRTFFWGKLNMVEVRWSPRMTLCAGVCSYEGKGRLCSIRLSKPLLMLRSRKDMVETLLHEMIHAYLFVTDNNTDHDGHGPQFCSHMRRINTRAGTNITIYHSFHDEVDEMRKHWWRCTGVCRDRPPYFGFVKRAMNRKPSPQDFWWPTHQASCSGTFEKVKEPENYGKKKAASKKETPTASQTTSNGSQSMLKFLTQVDTKPNTSPAFKEGSSNKQKSEKGSSISNLEGRPSSSSTIQRPNACGIPLNSKIFDKFRTSNRVQPKPPNSLVKKNPGKTLRTPLDEVCRHIRMTGEPSVNNGAPAFKSCDVITKFLTRKEQRQRVAFCSDEEGENVYTRKQSTVKTETHRKGVKRKSENSEDNTTQVKRIPRANLNDALPSLNRENRKVFPPPSPNRRTLTSGQESSIMKPPPQHETASGSESYSALIRGSDAGSSSSDSEDDVTLLEVLSPTAKGDNVNPEMCNCPICDKRVPVASVNRHIDVCLNETALDEFT